MTTKTLSELVHRTRQDPRFNVLVDMMVAYMIENKIAPDELRDAAYVASIKFLQTRPASDLIYRNDLQP